MGTQGTGRKRSTKKERSTAEDDALNLIAREAEARLAAKRAARAEAREIRMKELERQQKEIFQVQKKYYGLNTTVDDRVDGKWGDIEQWMEDSERYSRSSRIHTLSDDDERMSVGSRGSARSDLDAVGAYGGGGSTLHKKSKKKKKHKHKDRDKNGYDDDYSVISSRCSRLSDESRVSRASRLDLTNSVLSEDSRVSRSSRLDLQPASYASSDLYSLNGLSSSRNPGSAFSGYQSSLYEDSLCSGSRRVAGSGSHPLEYSSYRSSGSRASSRASSARASPVDNCSSVASILRSAASSSALPRDLDDVTIPDFSDVSRFVPTGGRISDVEDRDYLEKGSRAASALTAATLTSLGGTSSRRGSGETALTVDAETSIRDIKDALTEVEEKYRKAMVSNAQLDNEKNNLMYQVDTLKDSLMELEELLSESKREFGEKVKEYEREKHAHSMLQFQFNEMKEMLKQSEELLNEIRQLRMKQDGFVREVSDLQETVEWKDKKIAALERQKEYTDAIRIERDELREEVVQLKDILKKHGIVLGPDLNINGDVGETTVDGTPSMDPASQLAQNSQTSPTEGNSMLGNTEETHLRSSGEEEVDPEQQQEMHEEAKENHLSFDKTPCADVTLEITSEEQPAEEQHTCLPRHEDHTGENSLSKDLDVDIKDSATIETKDIIVCSPEQIQPDTCPEENVPETQISEGATNPGLDQTEIKSSRVHTQSDVREACDDLSGRQGSKKEVVIEEGSPNEFTFSEPSTQTHQEPEKVEEAENDEAEEEPSKSQAQGTTSTGKKKKKKKRGKKKAGSHDNKNEQKEKCKTEKDRESAAGENRCITVNETIGESKTDENEQNKQGPEKVAAEDKKEPTEILSATETLKEAIIDHNSNEGQTLELKTVEEEIMESPTETAGQERIDHVMDEQNEETASVEPVEPTRDDTTHECRKEDSQQTETEKEEEVESIQNSEQEAKLSTNVINNDGDDREYTLSVDNSKGEDTFTNDIINTETESVEVGGECVDEMKSECTATNSLELTRNENTEAESHGGDVAADEAESTAPSPDDFTGFKSSFDSQPSAAMNSACNDPPVGFSGNVPNEADDGEPVIETQEECCTVSPTFKDDTSESKQDGAGREETNGDSKEPGDVVHSDSECVTQNPETRLLKEEDHLDYVDSKTLQYDDQIDESNTEMSLKTEDASPSTETASPVKQKADAAEHPDHKNQPNKEESEPIVCIVAEPQHEFNKDKCENNDCSQPVQPNSDEEDGEDEEGRSFDFDDMDMEAAIVSDPHSDQELEEGVEVKQDESSAGLCQSNAESNGNTADSRDETCEVKKCTHVDALPQEQPKLDNVCADPQVILTEDGVAEAGSSLVEEGLDAVKHELQEENLDLAKSADQVAINKEAPPSGRDVKKSSKKGKGKGKEDCKMS
ncbi:uncharacterized protein lrrfip1a isoform X3 [Parambassis ranga]|uniref:Uncharacterized protein lrrfip1a isoform X3 n=1 Tax=Parambassis ranga TaxID=210632 RepID=A0A6P7HDD6_9TELE|nr:uncharacterized protein LOC114426491 isoform X3 [Parambassis ranga]